MLKRLFWLLVGAGFGFGVSFWLVRTVRKTMERYTPERVTTDLASALRGFGSDLRAAVAEGREAMHDREAELRATMAPTGRTQPERETGGPEGRPTAASTGTPGRDPEDVGNWRWGAGPSGGR